MNASDLAAAVLMFLATGHVDAAALARYADLYRVPRAVVWAVAWRESAHNLDPRLRGRACRGRHDCEVGRMQIKPSTARRVCPGLDVYTYDGNVECGARYLRLLYRERGSWPRAIRAYQCPTCTRPTEYEVQVLAKIGEIALRSRELEKNLR